MTIDKKTKLLLELCKSQQDTLLFLNKVMFQTTKNQRELPTEQVNAELLDLAWSSNDIIVDQPREREIRKILKEEFDVEIN